MNYRKEPKMMIRNVIRNFLVGDNVLGIICTASNLSMADPDRCAGKLLDNPVVQSMPEERLVPEDRLAEPVQVGESLGKDTAGHVPHCGNPQARNPVYYVRRFCF